MSTPTTTVRITHSWCPTCQTHPTGKARCSTPKPQGTWPAGVREQPCVVCAYLVMREAIATEHDGPLGCEWCGGDR